MTYRGWAKTGEQKYPAQSMTATAMNLIFPDGASPFIYWEQKKDLIPTFIKRSVKNIHSQSTQHNTRLRTKVTTKYEIEKQNTEQPCVKKSNTCYCVICRFNLQFLLPVSIKEQEFLNAAIQSRCEVGLPSHDLSETLCGWVTSEPLPFQSCTLGPLCIDHVYDGTQSLRVRCQVMW